MYTHNTQGSGKYLNARTRSIPWNLCSRTNSCSTLMLNSFLRCAWPHVCEWVSEWMRWENEGGTTSETPIESLQMRYKRRGRAGTKHRAFTAIDSKKQPTLCSTGTQAFKNSSHSKLGGIDGVPATSPWHTGKQFYTTPDPDRKRQSESTLAKE